MTLSVDSTQLMEESVNLKIYQYNYPKQRGRGNSFSKNQKQREESIQDLCVQAIPDALIYMKLEFYKKR